MAEPGRELVEVERLGRVAILRINNPRVNSLSSEVLLLLEQVLDELRADMPGALVVRGNDRFFAAGADVNELADRSTVEMAISAFQRAFDALAHFPRVSIAAVSGYALGGGLELALACDIRLAATNATFGSPEIKLGIIPGVGGTQRLARCVGAARATELVLSGRSIDAEEALRIGLVSEVVDLADLFEVANAQAATFAEGPLIAHGLAKRAINEGVDLPLDAALELERSLFLEAVQTEDAKIGLQHFLSKSTGTARFIGR